MHRRKELASKRCVKTFAAIAVVLGMLLACMLIFAEIRPSGKL